MIERDTQQAAPARSTCTGCWRIGAMLPAKPG